MIGFYNTDMSININNSNLLLYYPFNTNTLNYASGTGVADATISGPVISTSATVLSSGSIYFNGSTANFKVPAIQFSTNGITIAVWVKIMTIPPQSYSRIIDFGTGPGSNEIILQFPQETNYQLSFDIYGQSSGNTIGKYPTGYTFSDNNWHHVCASITPSGVWKIYVDGRSLSAVNFTGYPAINIPLTSSFIGKSNFNGDGWINAYMNQFLLFNRTLTNAEIGLLANYPQQIQISSLPSQVYSPYDSYSVIPASMPYPATGTATVQYNSALFQSGTSYSLKNSSNTTLTTNSYILTSSFTATGASYLLPMVVSSAGNIYGQGNTGSNSIYIYSLTGTSKGTITSSDWYFDFCMDPANNKMYCAGSTTFASVNLSTNVLTSYSSGWLNGVALGQDGFVYATTNSGYTIQKINPATGTQTNIFTSSGGNITSDTTGTFAGCVIDSNGFLYCVTRGVGYVYKFNTSGTLIGLFATVNSAYGGPFCITCDTATNNLYVSTTGSTGAIYKITPAGTVSLYNSTLGSSYSVFFDGTSNILFAADRSKIYLFPQTVNALSFSFPASNLGQGSNVLQIYDASNNTFGMPVVISVACFLEGSLIKCLSNNMFDDVYIPVEKLTKDTYVKTLSSGYVQIHSIGFTEIYNPSEETEIDNRLFKYKTGDERMPELFQDLYITGNHAALVETFSREEYDRVVKHMGAVYETEKRFRMPACLDPRAEPFVEPGTHKIWHFALQNPDIYTNYGVYANGILVESSSIRYLTELSKMELV